MEVFCSAVAQFQELILQFDASYGVERAERFVEKEELGFGRQCSRDADALALTAGKLARIAIEKLRRFQAHLIEQFVHAGRDALGRPALQSRHQADIFADGEMREEADFLDHVADAAPEFDEIPIGGGAVFHQHTARGGEQQPVQHLQRGGFSGAAAAEQNQRAAGLDAEV